MFKDLDVVGVFVPALSGLMLIAYGIIVVLRRLLVRVGFYRFVWHRSVLDLGLYVIVLGVVVSISRLLVE